MTLTVPDPVLGPWAKAFPARLWGLRVSQVAQAGARLSEFSTPVLTVHPASVAHNERTAFEWARAQGVELAPHGKTTMSPALWQGLLDQGAWGITLATPWQVQVALDAGVPRVMLANSVADPGAARWLRQELDRRTDVELVVWADSLAAVEVLDQVASPGSRPLAVLVELGAKGGRTGARTLEQARETAQAIVAAPSLRLAGVAAYEGPFGADRSAEQVARVDAYLETVARLHDELAPLYELPGIVTAGGSAWPDRVAAVLGTLASQATVLLRSGAFQIHDDGFYQRMSPFGRDIGTAPLRSAMHAWSRVVSAPEPGLALLDAGRRDVPFDIDLPLPQRVMGRAGEIAGCAVTALNDQHAFVRWEPGSADALAMGEVVRLGLSHPCTAFDKWRVVPAIDDPDADDPLVIGAVATCF
ncbi:alanine racemase [Demequina sp.]|uniref:alanine racemase n=1 Tax=Demequina sp. TaxID=2050685 RepID=UPI003A897BAD